MKQPPTNFRKKHRWSGRVLLAGALFLQLLLAGRGFALDPAKNVLQYNCRTWNRQNGLPASGINAIAQTKDGYLWFGTSAGLLRFDGIEFKLLDLHSVAKMRNSIVTGLASARSGGLWLGLENSSFGFYDGQSFSFRGGTNAETAVLNVRSVLEDKDGTLWLAAEGQAARLNRSGELESVLKSSSFTNLSLNAMCGYADRQDRLWFGTANQGVYYWQDGKITKLPDPKLDDTSVRCIAEDLDGRIWVGTSAGLYCYDASLQHKEIPLLMEEVRALLVDRQGVLWIGTSGRGLVRYQNGTYGILQNTDGLASDYVNAIAEDNEGSLWVGTRDGISQVSDVKFPIQPAAEDLKVKDALSVGASPRGGVWIASSGGVTRFDPKAKTYTTQSGLTNSYAKRVFEASNGDLYVVSGDRNLVVFSGGKAVAANAAPNMVVGMAEDEQGVVVSVGGELYRAGTNYFRPYTFNNEEKPPFYWIFNLASGRDGVIWVASVNGIFRVKDGAYQHWSAAEGPSDPRVLWICEDQDGVVWTGLLSGIARLKDNQVRLINRKHGLFDDNIYSVVPDDLGNLWVDSGRGIFRVARRSMNEFADGKTDHVECTIFDGIDSVKVTDKTEQQRVGCKTTDGRIWFPGPRGVVMIDPAHIPINRVAPPIHIDRIRANGKEISRSAQAVVPPGKGELEFHYNALSFIAPQKAQFRYRLEGYDKGWVDAGDRRMAFYTNLKPGPYTFRVIAANVDGVWNETGDTLKIELRPHYYQTAWFRLLCGGLAFAALIGIYFLRVRRLDLKQQSLQKTRDLLEVKVQERTSELRNEIEERKRAEETIASERQLLRTLIDLLPETVYIKDLDSRFLVVNKSLAKLLGKDTPSQVLGLSDADIYPAGLAAEFRAEEMKVFAGESLINQESTMVSPDGREHTVLTTKLPFRDGQGRICGLVGIGHDITERKRAEEALAKEQRLLNNLITTIPDTIYFKDRESRFIRINEAFARRQGLSDPSAVLGKTDFDIFGEQHAREAYADEQRIMATGHPMIDKEEREDWKDGHVTWASSTKMPLRNAAGKIIGIMGISRDITERKRTEEALHESEEKYRRLFDSSKDAFMTLAPPDWRFTSGNPSTIATFRARDEAEFVSKAPWELSPERQPDGRLSAEKAKAMIEQAMREGNHYFEWIHKRLDGEEFPATVLLTRLELKGRMLLNACVRDITERKRLETELNRERDLWRTLLDNSPDHIYFKDAQSRFIKASKAQALQFGVESPDEMVGKTDFDFFTDEHARPAFEDEQEIIRTGRPMIAKEEREVWKDGHVTWASSTKMPLCDGTGKIVGIMGISRDITERKRAEEAMRESEERFSGAFEHAPIGVALVSPDGRYLKVNRVLCDLVGYSEAELLTRTFQDITHPEDIEVDLENVRRVIAGEIRSYQMEKRYVHARGHLVTVLLNVSLVRDGQGQPRYFISQVQDITGRKRLEAQLFQSRKLETVGKLAGGVAHEFNSILTAIIGQSELLLGDLPAGSPLAKNAAEISQAAGRAATLTRQLLAYGRKQILQPEILDLNSVLAGMEGTLRHLMGQGADVRIAPAAGLKAVKADAGQIEQVIMNLAMNAADAMPNGGKLTLETANVSFDQESVGRYPELKPGDYVMLAITDTGAGMSEEVKARVFDPFFSTKGVGRGTGLGLSTCYGIIKQSGGHISVYSEPARGATFKIYLPQVEPQTKIPIQRLDSPRGIVGTAAPQEAGRIIPQGEPDLPRGTETILLVEDDPALREMAATLLRRLGYTVLAAANGIEALSLKQQRDNGHIDLLFTDVVMPHMSGKELADRVRALHPHTRILFTSAYTGNASPCGVERGGCPGDVAAPTPQVKGYSTAYSTGQVHQGVLNPGVTLLQKPFTPSALAHKLREVLDQPNAPKPDTAQKTFGFTKITDGVNTP